jgi:hypothetical protein
VFPVERGGKRPVGRLVPHGLADATRHEDTCRRWWGGVGEDGGPQEHGIGIAAGPSGLAIVDVDPRSGGKETIDALTAAHGPLPRVPVSCTGGGGWHLLFRAPEGIRLRNAAHVLGQGVDVKSAGAEGSAGGYVVAPPSWHPNGVQYEWHPDHRPSATPVQDMPPWMLAMARAVEPVATAPSTPSVARGSASPLSRASAYLATLPASVSGSGGHLALWTAAKALVVGFELGEADALALLANEFNPRCQPPWPNGALRHKVRSAAADTRSTRGWLLAGRPRA